MKTEITNLDWKSHQGHIPCHADGYHNTSHCRLKIKLVVLKISLSDTDINVASSSCQMIFCSLHLQTSRVTRGEGFFVGKKNHTPGSKSCSGSSWVVGTTSRILP